MGFVDILKRLARGAPQPTIQTRLTALDAIALAKQEAGDHWLSNSLNVATAERRPTGAVVWVVETTGVGSFLRFVIDDASGSVLDRKEHSGR